MKSAEIIRVNNLQHNVITWNDGETSESWTLEDASFVMVERTVSQTKFIYDLPKPPLGQNNLAPPVLNLDATLVAWITEQSRTPGMTTYNGKPTIHYQTTITLGSGFNPSEPPHRITYQAWIDAKNQVPLAFDDGTYLYNFTFSKTPPTDPLVLPARFQKEFQRYQNASAVPKHL